MLYVVEYSAVFFATFFILVFFFSLSYFFLSFFLDEISPVVTFPPFRLMDHRFFLFLFFGTQFSFTWALSIQFSSYFVMNNVKLFDFF